MYGINIKMFIWMAKEKNIKIKIKRQVCAMTHPTTYQVFFAVKTAN